MSRIVLSLVVGLVAAGCVDGRLDRARNTSDTRAGGVGPFGEGSAQAGDRSGEAGQNSVDHRGSVGGAGGR